MKLIDLLNKIANGEEVPKKIKTRITTYIYDEFAQDYVEESQEDVLKRETRITNDIFYEYYLFRKLGSGRYLCISQQLNYEVELIGEEPKKIEIPKHIPNEVIQDLDRAICPANVKCIAHKVNELINYLQHTNKGE